MGARRPPNQRPRRGCLNCEFCGRNCLSAEALKAHQNILHPHALKEKKKRSNSSTQASKIQKPDPSKVVIKKIVRKTQPKQSVKKISTEENSREVQKPQSIAAVKKISTEKDSPKVQPPQLQVAAKKNSTEDISPKMQKPQLKETVKKISAEESSPEVAEPKLKAETPNQKIFKLVDTEPQETPKPPTKVYTAPAKVRRLEYKCPKCEKSFPVRFIAMKHIEKYHCPNTKDRDVKPDSSDIIQPILIELCVRCNMKFPTPHDCPLQSKDVSSPVSYECSQCQARFKSTMLFTAHIEENHANVVHRMYFPLEKEFLTWKQHMEGQTECNYVIMQKISKTQTYYCSEFMESGVDGHPQFCPSTIITNSIDSDPSSKGLNVVFYPNHFGHKHKKYNKQQCLNSIARSGELNEQLIPSSDDDDLYIQFKTLMENIVLEAAKINVGTLKTLYNKAMDIKSTIDKYLIEEDEDEMDTTSLQSNVSNTIIINTVKEENEEINNSLNLRKRSRNISENTSSAKKNKTSAKKPDAFSLADDKDDITDDSSSTKKKRTAAKKSDTFSLADDKESDDGSSAKKKRTATKKPDTFSLADDKDTDKILKELDVPNKITPRKSLKSPSFNDSYKEFIDKTACKKPVTKKKTIVKTKMGTFKPSLSPKKDQKQHLSPEQEEEKSPKKEEKQSRVKLNKVKDIEYEVLEQENDCNILVLKM